MEYGALTVLAIVLIVILGFAFGIYNFCKGCNGLQERGMSASTSNPATVIVQRLRGSPNNPGNPFMISGLSVQDKSLPTYDELFAPPPSYEDIMRLNTVQQQGNQKQSISVRPSHHFVTLTILQSAPEPGPISPSSDTKSPKDSGCSSTAIVGETMSTSSSQLEGLSVVVRPFPQGSAKDPSSGSFPDSSVFKDDTRMKMSGDGNNSMPPSSVQQVFLAMEQSGRL